jgi:hypothetical protein
MKTSISTPTSEELENIENLREKSAETLKQEFDKRIKSED